jgi:hypothetical protein
MEDLDLKELDALIEEQGFDKQSNARGSERQKAGFKMAILKRMGTFFILNDEFKDLADVIDISKGGICFSSDYDFKRDQQILISSVGLKKNLTAEIRICHKFPIEKRNGYGCQFVKINDIKKVKV